MGWVKTIERRSKRGLMSTFGVFLRARAMSRDEVIAIRPKSILIIRQHNQMGDTLLAVPALRAVRECHPEARIGVVTSELGRGVLENNPYIDRLFTYEKSRPMEHLRLLSQIRRERFDLAIVLHTVSFSFTSALLAVLSGACVRVGSTSHAIGGRLTGSYFNLTLPLPTETELQAMNEAEHNLYPLAAIGIGTNDIAPVIVPTIEQAGRAETFATRAWRKGALRLAVHPGAGKTENIWPPENFALAVDALAESREIAVVAVEGPRDAGSVQRFCEACRCDVQVARGQSIGEVAALLRIADLVLCNDTGVMHVSASAGARTLAVFGKTDPGRWAPRCEGLATVQSPDRKLESVTVEMVVRAAAEQLDLVMRAQRDA